jgi:hypothetical protein
MTTSFVSKVGCWPVLAGEESSDSECKGVLLLPREWGK